MGGSQLVGIVFILSYVPRLIKDIWTNLFICLSAYTFQLVPFKFRRNWFCSFLVNVNNAYLIVFVYIDDILISLSHRFY